MSPSAGRNLIIQLADKECEYSETFAFFMCSKLANPHYSPEIFAQMTVINFTVTMGGLEQQLLSRVVQMERPELEEQKQKVLNRQRSPNPDVGVARLPFCYPILVSPFYCHVFDTHGGSAHRGGQPQ